MTVDPILPPTDPGAPCRCCRTDLPLDGMGFCSACAARRVKVGVLRRGVAWEWAIVLFDRGSAGPRLLPFLVAAWVPSQQEAALHYHSLDLPDLEDEGLRLWRTDERYRHEIIETSAALLNDEHKAATVRKEARRHALLG